MAVPPMILEPVFTNNILNQQEVSALIYDGNIDLIQRIWRIPIGWDGDPLDIPAFQPPFDRALINVDYQLCYTNPDGREADVMAAKLQGDHVSAQERAFRYRHASHIRCGMHAANRRAGHGAPDDGIFARMVDHVLDVIVSRNAGD